MGRNGHHHARWQPAQGKQPKTGIILQVIRKCLVLLACDNYDVYLEWNRSATYTLTAAHQTAYLTGQPAFNRGSPDAGLTVNAMKVLQQKLHDKGYAVGGSTTSWAPAHAKRSARNRRGSSCR